MFAFSGASKMGCPVIETDLRLTKDGHLVTFHDETLERTTNGRGLVRDHTLAALKTLDAGGEFTDNSGERPYRSKGLSIPTLREAMEACPNVAFNVELKDADPEAQQTLWGIIREQHLYDRVIVAAFDHRTIQQFRCLSGHRVPTAASRSEVLRFWSATRAGLAHLLRREYHALQVPETAFGLSLVSHQLIDAARRCGIRVHVWTVNELTDMERLLALGVDGLMSDRPDTLLEVLDRCGTSPAAVGA